MKSSKESTRIARQLFKASVNEAGIDESVVRIIMGKLKNEKPRGYLQVLEKYFDLLRLEVERNRAVIESAVELDEPTRDRVVSDLRKKYGDRIEPEFTTDGSLLGGMRIRVGSDVWDGSVRNRIERLSEKFN